MNKYRLVKVTDKYYLDNRVSYVIEKHKRFLWWQWWSEDLSSIFCVINFRFTDEQHARHVLKLFNAGKGFIEREVIA